jgi:uncharacterized protein with WD repeat
MVKIYKISFSTTNIKVHFQLENLAEDLTAIVKNLSDLVGVCTAHATNEEFAIKNLILAMLNQSDCSILEETVFEFTYNAQARVSSCTIIGKAILEKKPISL